MSIEYFVEGKVRIETGGDNISFSKENISNNGKNFAQKGMTTGTSYNDPKTLLQVRN